MHNAKMQVSEQFEKLPEQIFLQFCPVLKPCVSVADAFFKWKKWADIFPHPVTP